MKIIYTAIFLLINIENNYNFMKLFQVIHHHYKLYFFQIFK